MRPFTRATSLAGAVLTAVFLAILGSEIARERSPEAGPVRTEPIRRNMDRLEKVLMTVERHLGTIPTVSESRQIELMDAAVGLLKEYLLPHLEAEEAVLYPAVDRLFPAAPFAWTEPARKEHRILRRWIEELEAHVNASLPDPFSFTRCLERLLGLIEAHFELDRDVVLPLLDAESPCAGLRSR